MCGMLNNSHWGEPVWGSAEAVHSLHHPVWMHFWFLGSPLGLWDIYIRVVSTEVWLLHLCGWERIRVEPALACDSWDKQVSRPQDVSVVLATEEADRVTGLHLELPGTGTLAASRNWQMLLLAAGRSGGKSRVWRQQDSNKKKLLPRASQRVLSQRVPSTWEIGYQSRCSCRKTTYYPATRPAESTRGSERVTQWTGLK